MPIVETQTFRLAPGVDDVPFLAADERVQTEVMYLQPGFVRRTTTKADDGEWFVIAIWGDTDSADAGQAAADAHDAGRALQELVAPGSLVVKRYSTFD